MIYAVGDIHGHVNLLSQMIDQIRKDTRKYPKTNHKIIFLGDYVDRGPDSNSVIELLRAGIDGFETICLRGNHEDMMLNFIIEPNSKNARAGPGTAAMKL